MGKTTLFAGWAALLGLSLYFAWATHDLRGDGREVVASVDKASGKVYQRPANISVYEDVGAGDFLFNDDYISTGAGATAELTLYNGKTLVIGENSLVHLTVGFDDSGLGEGIVTLLKGDMLARGEGAQGGARAGRAVKFNVGKNSVSDNGGDAGIRISKKVEETEATVRVETGSASVTGADSEIKEIKTNDILKLASAAPALQPLVTTPVTSLASAKLPVIKMEPQAIAANDKLISSLPTTLRKINLASIKPIETALPKASIPEVKPQAEPDPVPEVKPEVKPEPVPAPVQVKKKQVKKKAKKQIKVAAVSPKAPPPVVPFTVILRSSNPSAFSGPGTYLVRNQSLFAKVTGSPSTENLLTIKQKLGGQFFFRGNAQAFSGAASLKALEGQNTVYAVGSKGIQQIDAKLIRSRPVALDLLVDGGYTIFTEKVDLINVGH